MDTVLIQKYELMMFDISCKIERENILSCRIYKLALPTANQQSIIGIKFKLVNVINMLQLLLTCFPVADDEIKSETCVNNNSFKKLHVAVINLIKPRNVNRCLNCKFELLSFYWKTIFVNINMSSTRYCIAEHSIVVIWQHCHVLIGSVILS